MGDENAETDLLSPEGRCKVQKALLCHVTHK
jgi:hypothetical protein